MSHKDIKTRIKAFIGKHFQYELKPDEDIFSLGFVNSLFAMQLVTFVESEFDITVEDEDLELDNFRTVNAIDSLVQKKLSG